jgi:hypothetical protein
VRVTVYSQDGSRKVVRERSGGHRGFGPTMGQAVEDCAKAAETDATKRAFVTFGNIFGLALYDREQRNVGAPEPRIPTKRTLTPIEDGLTRSSARHRSVSALSRHRRGPLCQTSAIVGRQRFHTEPKEPDRTKAHAVAASGDRVPGRGRGCA